MTEALLAEIARPVPEADVTASGVLRVLRQLVDGHVAHGQFTLGLHASTP